MISSPHRTKMQTQYPVFFFVPKREAFLHRSKGWEGTPSVPRFPDHAGLLKHASSQMHCGTRAKQKTTPMHAAFFLPATFFAYMRLRLSMKMQNSSYVM